MNETELQPKKHRFPISLAVFAILFFAVILISNLKAVNSWLGYVMDILSPLLIGLVLAYLSNPFFRFFERKAFFKIKSKNWRRVLSLVMTYIILFAIFAGLLLLIIPQLISSIWNFVLNFQSYLASVVDLINGWIEYLNGVLPPKEGGLPAIQYLDFQEIMTYVQSLIQELPDRLLQFFSSETFDPSKVAQVVVGIFNYAASLLTDIIFGLFVSIYLLASKEKRYAQVSKFRKAYLPETFNRRITRFLTIADRSFGGFLRGKILDSTIVGFLVYFTCLIFNIPYAVLVSVIVGITDIVPVIGPFIGVIPSAIIILLTDPVKVIVFVLSILIIQQIDGNIIAPKILGDNTGVSSLCVMIAILVMGDLMGLVGMIIGVPLFATVIELAKIYLDKRLSEKGISTSSDSDLSPNAPPIPQMPPEPAPVSADEDSYRGSLTETEQLGIQLFAHAKRRRLFETGTDSEISEFINDAGKLFASGSSAQDFGSDGPAGGETAGKAGSAVEPELSRDAGTAAQPEQDSDAPASEDSSVNGGDEA